MLKSRLIVTTLAGFAFAGAACNVILGNDEHAVDTPDDAGEGGVTHAKDSGNASAPEASAPEASAPDSSVASDSSTASDSSAAKDAWVSPDTGVPPSDAGADVSTGPTDGSTTADAVVPVPDASLPPDASGPPADAGTCTNGLAACGGATCSIDLQTNGANCGACGHSCRGSACNAGVCDPTVLVTGKSGTADLEYASILVDANNIYWLSAGAALYSAPKAGGTPTTIRIQVADTPTDIAFDGTNLFWSAYYGNEAHRISPTSFANDVSLDSCNLGRGIAVDDTHVYTTTLCDSSVPGTVRRADKGASGTTTAVSFTTSVVPGVTLSGTIDQIVADADRIYWNQGQTILSALKTNGKPMVVLKNLNVNRMAFDDTTMYVTAPPSVFKVDKINGGNPSAFFENTAGEPEDIKVRDGYVYWSDAGNANGCIFRMGINETVPLVLAKGEGRTKNLAIDDQYVYWISRTSSAIKRVAR